MVAAVAPRPDAPSPLYELKNPSRFEQLGDYLRAGVWHIWIGFDHILFLLSLLLPAVLVWAAPRWQPAALRSRRAKPSLDPRGGTCACPR